MGKESPLTAATLPGESMKTDKTNGSEKTLGSSEDSLSLLIIDSYLNYYQFTLQSLKEG